MANVTQRASYSYPYMQTNPRFSSFLNRMPWGNQIFRNLTELNPVYDKFSELIPARSEIVRDMSVFDTVTPDRDGIFGGSELTTDARFAKYMYSDFDSDKLRRLGEFRTMSMYAPVADCLDEIADELLFEDSGLYAKLEFNGVGDKETRNELSREFETFLDIFELKAKGWDMVRQFIVEGEVFFENVINADHPEYGIVGLVRIPTELCVPIYENVQNSRLKNFLVKRPVYNETTREVDHDDLIAFRKEQITYINSDLYSYDTNFVLPYIERARRAYKQLSMMEDCILIYRMARSPEKLVFNVDVGNMSPPQAEKFLHRLMNAFNTRKTYDFNSGRPHQTYDATSMTDALWIPKRAGTEGTQVTTLTSQANFGQMDDLLYFQKQLYRSMFVPTSRLNPDGDPFKDGNDISREELRFKRFIQRVQKRIAIGVKATFITHLKLRGYWKQYNLSSFDFDVVFNTSSVFDEMRKQQLLDIRLNNFGNISQNEGISNSFSQKKYLGLTDAEIAANREARKADAALAWEIQMITNSGPNWQKLADQQAKAAGEMADAMGGGGGGGMSGGDMGGGDTGGDAGGDMGGGDMGADAGGGDMGGGEAAPPPPADAGGGAPPA